MKIISIKLENYLANWITNSAQKNDVTISEFIRDLLYEKMRQGSIVTNDTQKLKKSNFVQPNRAEVGYIIFTAKLLEKFIIATEEQGEILRDLAFTEAEHLLSQLHLDGKSQRFSIRLEEQLFVWLDKEAKRLHLKLVPMIRKLIEITCEQNNFVTKPEISATQKTAIEYQIIGCKLLEKLVNELVEDAEEFVKEAHASAKAALLKLGLQQASTINSESI